MPRTRRDILKAAGAVSALAALPLPAQTVTPFVTSAAVNPTNTIQALTLYIADTMKRNLANLFDD